MKALLCIMLAIVSCFSLAACAHSDAQSGTTETTPQIISRTYDLAQDLDSFKCHGRTSATQNGLNCDLSASGIEFNAYIEGELKVKIKASANCYYTLYIDGVRSETRFLFREGTRTLTLANFEQGGVHNIRLLKQTEANNALSTIRTVEFTGYITTLPEDKMLIEFIGDSITCGYGNLCAPDAPQPGSALNQDATQSFAFRTAEALGADARLVSCTGIGIASGYRTFVMESYYAAASYARNPQEKYKPDRAPDLIVINLGTNDQNKNSDTATLMQKVPALIQLIRTTYGKDIPIVWVHGMMGEGKWTVIKSALDANFRGEQSGIYELSVPMNKKGGNGHPEMQAHIDTAALLAAFIKDKGLDKAS